MTKGYKIAIGGLILAALVQLYQKGREMELLQRTIYGEARNQRYEGMVAVANAIMNRTKSNRSFGGSLVQVIMRPWAFSLWNSPDGNYKATLAANDNDPEFKMAGDIARAALDGTLADNTGGATHYFNPSVVARPKWADHEGSVETVKIGDHVFFKGVW